MFNNSVIFEKKNQKYEKIQLFKDWMPKNVTSAFL